MGGAEGFDSALLALLGRVAEALEAGNRAPGAAKTLPEAGARAFRWNPRSGFCPIARPARTKPSLLVGIDDQKEAFYANVERHLAGKPAVDVLLWGERGTGKTSLVGSLLQKFPQKGWALLHLTGEALPFLPDLLDRLAADPRRWIVFFDDLNLDAAGEAAHELKVFLEGGLSERPANALAVATSNRRHLLSERFPSADSLHPQEEVAEAISLADRFGLSLGFYAMEQEDYLSAVDAQLKALGHRGPAGALHREALRFALERGIRSGRTAAHFARLNVLRTK